jgi:GR25 family glycosyltransferase involved in LPS biosynthesis
MPFLLFHGGFSGLAVALQSLLVLLSPKPERRRALEFLRNGARLRAMRWDGVQDYPVYVINRAKDTERLQGFSESCRKWGIHFERVEAANCADPNFDFRPYEKDIAETFYGKTQFLRGAVGCFLTHSAAWRKLLESDFSHAMICEDDAVFLGPLPKRISGYGFPTDVDLVFVNERTAGGLYGGNREMPNKPNPFEVFPVGEAINRILRMGSKVSAIGTDGYILSRGGAEKLLANLRSIGISMEVDWFLFLHSLSVGEREKFMSLDNTGRFDLLTFSDIRTHAAVLIPSLVEQRGGESTISFNNPKNYVSRDQMRIHSK